MQTPNLEDFDQKVFAKEIRAFRKKHALSIRKFVKAAKISLATLQRIDTGKCDVTIKIAAKIQKFMRVFKPVGGA